MTAPRRIQRRRTKGWRAPEGAVIVSHPSRFGNPFTISMAYDIGYAQPGDVDAARRACAGAFIEWMNGNRHMWQSEAGDQRRRRILADLHLLRGKDLACTCPLPEPGEPDHCHAAVLLRLANGGGGRMTSDMELARLRSRVRDLEEQLAAERQRGDDLRDQLAGARAAVEAEQAAHQYTRLVGPPATPRRPRPVRDVPGGGL